MKLIQLNAWGGRLDYALTNFFESSAADFICLQEAMNIKGEVGLFLPLEGIQAAAGLKYTAFSPAFSIRFMRRMAGFGNAILSREPIKKTEVIFTHQQHHKDFDYTEHGSSNMRNFIHAVVEIKGVSCNLLTHHGYWVREHKNGNPETLKQMTQVGEYIDGLNGPIILTGDFNLSPHSESLGQINKRLTNLSIKYRLKTTRNSLTTKTEVCDYIFVNDLVKVKSFEASEELVSDHKPLVLEFELF